MGFWRNLGEFLHIVKKEEHMEHIEIEPEHFEEVSD